MEYAAESNCAEGDGAAVLDALLCSATARKCLYVMLNPAQITTRDESGALCVQGTKQTSFGSMAADGPPTTLSDTGIDKVAFLQGNLARDATYFLNGTPVGARDLFQARLCCLVPWPCCLTWPCGKPHAH